MFILRGRFILIGLVVLIAWGCGVSNRYAPDDSSIDTAYDSQIESGVNDVGVIPQDAASGSQIESGVIDVSVIPIDAATDVGANTSTTNTCRVVDLEENNTNDAGADDIDTTTPKMTGMISVNGDCLSGVEVCLIAGSTYGSEAYSTFTNRYGVFEVRARAEGIPPDYTLTPRKAGYQFEPTSSPLSTSMWASGGYRLSFTAVEVGLPDYATGQWRVVNESCDNAGDSSINCDILNDFSDRFKYRAGDVVAFENGCLFGGIDCVEGLLYSDRNAFCRGDSFMSESFDSSGAYDPDTRNWQIDRTYRHRSDGIFVDTTQHIILKSE
jgi:hypothetical protein